MEKKSVAIFQILTATPDCLAAIDVLKEKRLIESSHEPILLYETGRSMERGLTASEIILTGIVTAASGITTKVIADWISDKIKPKKDQVHLKINGSIIITFESAEIQKAIESKTSTSDKNSFER